MRKGLDRAGPDRPEMGRQRRCEIPMRRLPMPPLPSLPALALALLLAPGGALAGACPRPAYPAAFLKPVPTRNIDQALFSRAMQMEADYARCRRGRAHVATAPELTEAAAGHSRWMAGARRLDHDSTVPGRRSLKARMRATGLRFRSAAENIAAFDRYRFPDGAFRIRNADACIFATQAGKPIPPHSYASLAQAVIAGWMNSPGHRKNLLHRRIRLVGAGLGFDPTAPYCGRFYITQDYLG